MCVPIKNTLRRLAEFCGMVGGATKMIFLGESKISSKIKNPKIQDFLG